MMCAIGKEPCEKGRVGKTRAFAMLEAKARYAVDAKKVAASCRIERLNESALICRFASCGLGR